MLLLSISHLNQRGKSFLVSAAPHAEHAIILSILLFSASSITFFITSERNIGGVVSFDHGKSERREIFNTFMIASQFFIGAAKSDFFSTDPSKTFNRSWVYLIFRRSLTKQFNS